MEGVSYFVCGWVMIKSQLMGGVRLWEAFINGSLTVLPLVISNSVGCLLLFIVTLSLASFSFLHMSLPLVALMYLILLILTNFRTYLIW